MKDLARHMAPLKARVMSMLARGIVKIINDGHGIQSLQATFLQNEVRDGLERFQNFGFSSNPLPGAEAIAAFLGGNKDHGIVLVVDDRKRRFKGLSAGESVIYNSVAGCYIRLMADGTIYIKSPTKVIVDAPSLECTGDIKDNSAGTGKTMAAMRTTYNTHTHPANGAAPTQQM